MNRVYGDLNMNEQGLFFPMLNETKNRDRPLARHGDPATSYEAAEKLAKSGRLRGQRRAVLETLRQCNGATHGELGAVMGLHWLIAVRRLPELERCFALVRGGIAFPGKQPGFGVVVGLRPVHDPDRPCEMYVLDEAESPDLRALLRQCATLARKYNTGYRQGERFRWVGDGKSTVGRRTIAEINAERSGESRDSLTVYWTPILDMQRPYSYMVPLLRQLLDPTNCELHLQDSVLDERLKQIERAEDLTELSFGAFPSVEALAFIAVHLKDEADAILRDMLNPPLHHQSYDPFGYLER